MTTPEKPSPGPWEHDGEVRWDALAGPHEIHTGDFEVYAKDADATLVAIVNGQIAQGEANARLIAQAWTIPELLTALEEIGRPGNCCETPGCCEDDPMCDAMIARAALALANEETE